LEGLFLVFLTGKENGGMLENYRYRIRTMNTKKKEGNLPTS
jgi:hypothetical protein